ncbi:MAG: hypothetical protein IJI45_03085 [Anaerolineaceae bacterium]|nr:hypothetical protein [Anaerolineaceae bacterium]
MKRETITLMLNSIDDGYISEADVFDPDSIQEPPERIVHMKKRIVTFALAAALLLSLCVVAYAADLFGIRAMLMKNSTPDNPDSGYVSFTQPQDVPEEMDESIRAKIDNSTKAWAEWTAWSRENGIYEPESCKAPEGTKTSAVEENADGTLTMIFYSDSNSENEIERRIISAEDYEACEAFWEARAKGFSGYDYPYHVYTQAMADKLESIATNYGLKLRHQRTSMFQNHDNVAEFSTREEITARINEVCAGGKSLFRVEPTGYDKFYYFDEGTFAVSFYTTENQTNTGTSCYLYNSPYGTLSSGFEIFGEVQDISAFTTRYHTTPDGTRLTVLQSGTDIFAYVYLENSFVTLHITQLNGLTEPEIDTILDMVDFSTI